MAGEKGKIALFLTCFLTAFALAPQAYAGRAADDAKPQISRAAKLSPAKTATMKAAKAKDSRALANLMLAHNGEDMRATHAPIGAASSIPYGWVDFCGRQPQECEQAALEARDLPMNDKNWATLNRINRQVNAAIEPVSNFDHWGTVLDHWDYPADGKGDCKIYALEKRRELMEMGFPRQALLMTIVKDQNGQGHTILMVVTSEGDFILDNMTNQILPWSSTGYRYLKRQSQEDPNVWMTIETAAHSS